MGKRIFALMIKEFLALLKDRKGRLVLIVPPMIQLVVFGYAATFDLKRVPYAVYSEDRGHASRDLLAAFKGSSSFALKAQLNDESRIAGLVESRQVLMVIRIGRNFSSDLLSGKPAAIQIIADGRNSNTAMLVVNYAGTIVKAFNSDWAAKHGSAIPVHIETRSWFNPNLESRWFFIPGIVGLLTLLVTVLVTALSVAREREQGTFDQLLVTPLSPIEILIGKALPGFLIGVGEATVVTLAAVLWFKVPLLGSILALYIGILLFLLSAVGMGLMISSIAVTQQQGLLGAFFFMVPAIILSGFATPIRNMPSIVQDITLVNPLRYFLVVLRGVFLQGTPFRLLLPELWPLALIGVISLATARWLFRNRMY